MAKLMLIGDPHGQPNNLKDLDSVFALAADILAKQGVDYVYIMGDLFHTHAILRQEVIDFYQKRLKLLHGLNQVRPGVIVGNHDLLGPTNGSTNAVSLVLSDVATAIAEPMQVAPNVWAVPFIPDNKEFVRICNEEVPHDSILLCHQTFEGSRFENGFYAPEGVDQGLIPQKVVISGHIHNRQTIGKVTYIGTPRAVTASEANEDKGIALFDTTTKEIAYISTNHLVKCYKHIEIHQDGNTTIPRDLNFDKDDVRVSIEGTEEFYAEFLRNNGWIIGKAKIIPNIKKELGKQINLETSASMHDALKKYVFEVAGLEDSIKETVWTKLQEIMPNL